MNNEEAYKLYRAHKVELFEIIEDLIDRAPDPDILKVVFGCETEEDKAKYQKELQEYLDSEYPKLRENLKELGFESKSNLQFYGN